MQLNHTIYHQIETSECAKNNWVTYNCAYHKILTVPRPSAKAYLILVTSVCHQPHLAIQQRAASTLSSPLSIRTAVIINYSPTHLCFQKMWLILYCLEDAL